MLLNGRRRNEEDIGGGKCRPLVFSTIGVIERVQTLFKRLSQMTFSLPDTVYSTFTLVLSRYFFIRKTYSRLSLIRTPRGKIVCSNYREIRIIESRSKFKLARELAEGEQKIVRIIERFELEKFE